MSPHALTSFALFTSLALMSACSPRPHPNDTKVGTRQTAPPPAPLVAAPTPPQEASTTPAAAFRESDPGETAEARPSYLPPVALGRLHVFPVVLAASAQEDPGPLMLLDEALEKGLAEVREVGGEDAVPTMNLDNRDNRGPRAGARNHLDHRDILPGNRRQDPAPDEDQVQVQIQRRAGEPVEQVQVQGQMRGRAGGAVVNTLVIENKSDIPIFVLAGTVVRGGKQDRQIGQDFVVDAKQTTPVDAFCVERGRWTMEREGQTTGGRFVAVSSLANAKVRAAGQYAKDQSAVWDNVAKVNKAHSKSAASDTLLATLEAPDVEAALVKRSTELGAALRAAASPGELVGFAWAIDGHVQGLRYFAHTRVFDLVEDKLTRAVAADVLTAEAEGPSPAELKPPTVADLETFVAAVASAEEVRHDTPAANENVYKQSEKAWASKTELKGKAGKKARALAWDYLAK